MMHSDDDARRAEAGLANDRDVNLLAEDRGEMHTSTSATDDVSRSNELDRTLSLREEELHAKRTPVETGQVTVGKEIKEEQRTMEVPVSREEVYLERQPIERRPADESIGNERAEIDVPVREERVDVEKQPYVYQEVGVGKRQTTDTQQVSDTVRREELRVDRQGDVKGATLEGAEDLPPERNV
jgi:uncharacterized protein (TIGR02271 family)